ncbi:MAG: hypothetical protein SVP52_03430, partial [Chloroflexota bacterium]|nr:hypothetical protein [Chloroflexota bacterium]
VSYLANGDKSYPKELIEVFSSGRIAALNDWRKLELVTKGRRKVKRHTLAQDKGHKDAWLAFRNALLEEKMPPIPYDQLLGVSQAAFAAVESLRSGESVEITAN